MSNLLFGGALLKALKKTPPPAPVELKPKFDKAAYDDATAGYITATSSTSTVAIDATGLTGLTGAPVRDGTDPKKWTFTTKAGDSEITMVATESETGATSGTDTSKVNKKTPPPAPVELKPKSKPNNNK